MKKILFLATMLLGTVATYAQTDDYTPLVREGSEWCYLGDCYQSKKYIQYGITVLEVYHYYRFEGDTVAYNHKYKILNRYEKLLCERSDGSRFLMDYEIWEPFAFVREENKKVYACQCRSHVHRNTGYDEYSLLSLSSNDYNGIVPLLGCLSDKYAKDGISVSLPSQRADKFSLKLAKLAQTVRKGTITIAIEAGSQRLRDVVNKNLNEEQIFSSILSAYEAG